MTFSDIKECTFRPFVNKQRGKQMYTIKEWVEKLGENFKSRFPMVYKMGIYRRSIIHYNKLEYT